MTRSARDRSAMWLCAVVVVGGLVMLLRPGGDQEARMAALVTIVGVGSAGVAIWVLSRPRRPRIADVEPPRMIVGAPPNAHRWVPASRQIGIVITQPRTRMLAVVAGCGVAIGNGALALAVNQARAVPSVTRDRAAWTLIVIFGALGMVALVGLVRHRVLALLPGGLLSRQAGGSAFVPWSALTHVGVFTAYDHSVVGLVLGPGARLTGLLGPMRPLQRAHYGCDVPLPRVAPFDTSGLARLLDQLHRDPELREQLSEPEAVAMVMDLAFATDEDADR